MSGSVGNNLSSLFEYVSKMYNVAPSTTIGPQAGLSGVEEESIWIKPSDQELTRDISALMLLPPTLSLAAFQNIALNFSDKFSITNVAAAGGDLKAFGATETGITLAAAFAWAQTQNQESNLVQVLLGNAQKNPLEVALTEFVSQAEIIPVDALGIQLLLRQMPVLTAVIHTVDPTLVMKAFSIAQQQVVLSLLDKWIESQAKLAQESKEAAKDKDIQLQQAALQILRNYFEKVSTKEDALTSSVLSVVIGSLLTNGVSLSAASMASPFVSAMSGIGESIPLLAGIPPNIQALMGSLSLGLISATTTWATPVAMALAKASITLSPQQAEIDAANSYAITLFSFLMNPALEAFLAGQVDSAVASGQIDRSQGNLAIAAFRTSLLVDAMAALYKAVHGGVTGKELLALIKDPSKLSKTDYPETLITSLKTLITLINDSMKDLPADVSEKLLTQLADRYDKELQLDGVREPISSVVTVCKESVRKEELSV